MPSFIELWEDADEADYLSGGIDSIPEDEYEDYIAGCFIALSEDEK